MAEEKEIDGVGNPKVDADPMLGLIASYLQQHGWNVVVIGGARVQQPIGERKFNYEFVVRFTGSPPPALAGGPR